MKKTIAILTGAGMSAESGIKTFRDADGLWENYPVMEVASHTGYLKNPALIHEFYNERRKQLVECKPNAGHYGIVDLEEKYNVKVITQNVDNLHERAGSSSVLHLHGELMKVEAVDNENLVFELSEDNLETSVDTVIDGHKVRPHIVFFEEAVPNITPAAEIVKSADIVVIIGTSMVVYPAAGLLYYAKPGTPIYYIDPNPAKIEARGVTVIAKLATEGVKELKDLLL